METERGCNGRNDLGGHADGSAAAHRRSTCGTLRSVLRPGYSETAAGRSKVMVIMNRVKSGVAYPVNVPWLLVKVK